MEYLTTHDIIWVNNTIVGQPQPFNYVTLEAAMAAQYAYGQSDDVPAQAANFLNTLLFRGPFTAGNRRTALIAALTFLNANGYATAATDAEAAQLTLSLSQGQITPQDAMARLAAPAQQPISPGLTLRTLITHECNLHVEALRALTPGD